MKRFNVYPVNHQEGNKIETEEGVFVKHADLIPVFIKCIQDICELDPADVNNPDTVSISISDLGTILQRNLGLSE